MTKVLRILALLLVASPGFAQAPRTYAQPELDRMLAPIALYPDALLAQVLMAATYPVDVIEAARWSRANPGLQGDDAVRAVAGEPWDASVKSLVAFPQLLWRMDEQLDWMRSLGEAFVSQEPQVMDTVQDLRRRAQAAGNLQSGEQMTVQQQGPAIVIQPASPQYVYVPYYDPTVVYGTWGWPAYRPVYWSPWPGYARHYRPGVPAGFWWGQPVGLSLNFFYGHADWRRRQVRVDHGNNHYYRPPAIVNPTVVVDRGHRQREPRRREVQSPAQSPSQAQPAFERHEVHHEHRVQPVRVQVPVQVQARPQARMPAAVAPPQPRAERPERHEPRHEPHHGPRNEHRAAGRQRS